MKARRLLLMCSNVITTTNPANAGDVPSTTAVGLGDTTPASVTGVETPNPPPLYTTLATFAYRRREESTLLVSGLVAGLLPTDQLNFTLAPNTPVGTETVTVSRGPAETSISRKTHPDGHDS